MIRLICQKCSLVWYTANTRPNQKCNNCGGSLHETELINSKDIERNTRNVSEKKNECKVIYLSFN